MKIAKQHLSFLFCIFFLLLVSVTMGQKCKNFHKKKCFSFGYTFEYSKQSQDFKIEVGETIEIDVMVMAGYEYNFAVCFNSKLWGVVFEIVDEKKTKKYYSSKDEIEQYHAFNKQFAVDETKMLKVILKVPFDGNRAFKYAPPSCGGLLVEYNKQPDLGF